MTASSKNAQIARIGKTMRAIRAMKGLTQSEMAARLEISQNHLSNLENGKREPGILLLSRFSKLTQIPIDLFFILALEPSRLGEKKEALLADIQLLFSEIIDHGATADSKD
jgi:transcriptional regulator with XRE-family HTH domain